MTLKEAINIRTSRRNYDSRRISPEVQNTLIGIINAANNHPGSHIHFRLVTDDTKAFGSFRKTYGLFSGVHTYITATGRSDDIKAQQLIGYYGELMILTVTSMGLDTCWVGATYDKAHVNMSLSDDEQLYCLICIGYAKDRHSIGERLAHTMTHRQTHTADEIISCDHKIPRWFMDGVNAVLKAPSARNRLPVHFELKNGCVRAWADANGGYENIDLGIAKLHFELGADYIFYDLRENTSPTVLP